MKVRVQLFSRLRDLAGESEIDLDAPEGASVNDLLKRLYARTPSLQNWDKSILVAIGVEFVPRNHLVKNGDEIAVMPPVQGG